PFRKGVSNPRQKPQGMPRWTGEAGRTLPPSTATRRRYVDHVDVLSAGLRGVPEGENSTIGVTMAPPLAYEFLRSAREQSRNRRGGPAAGGNRRRRCRLSAAPPRFGARAARECAARACARRDARR